MLSRSEVEGYIKQIPKGITSDEWRYASATITGFSEDKSVSEISGYYSIDKDIVKYWMDYFNFTNIKEQKSSKRSSKTKVIQDYLNKNEGKIINFAKLADELNISTPTVYNYYNSNRAYFKKINRGTFEILNPKNERKISK